MEILSIKVENFKRIQRAEIKPDGNVVIIGGDNAQGKSSVLDAIAALFCGKDALPSKPVRDGADRADLSADCGDFVLSLAIKPDGQTTLKITTKDGAIIPKPQTWLNERIGKLSFDPLAFTRLPEKEQAETLRRLVGVDVTDLDSRKATLFAQRLQVGRDRDAADGAVKTLPPEFLGVPDAELSAADVLVELTEAQRLQSSVDNLRSEAMRLETEAAAFEQRADERHAEHDAVNPEPAIEALNAEIDRQIAELNARRVSESRRIREEADAKKSDLHTRAVNNRNAAMKARQNAAENRKTADAVTLPDLDAIKSKAANVDAINAKVRANAQRKAAHDKFTSLAARYKAMSDELDAIAAERLARIQAAQYPVAGLGFADDGAVTFAEIPLSQASQAEQIRVSMAIAQAMNPQLRVVLVRDASLLDRRSMAMVAEMAQASGTQLWIERVGDGDEGAIVIDDGRVRESKAAQGALL